MAGCKNRGSFTSKFVLDPNPSLMAKCIQTTNEIPTAWAAFRHGAHQTSWAACLVTISHFVQNRNYLSLLLQAFVQLSYVIIDPRYLLGCSVQGTARGGALRSALALHNTAGAISFCTLQNLLCQIEKRVTPDGFKNHGTA